MTEERPFRPRQDSGTTEEMPSDAPKAGKVGLAALFSLTPHWRGVFVCLLVVCSTFLAWSFGPAIISVVADWVKR